MLFIKHFSEYRNLIPIVEFPYLLLIPPDTRLPAQAYYTLMFLINLALLFSIAGAFLA